MIKKILKEVKKHKKYKDIADEVVIDKINKYLKGNYSVTHIDKQLIKDIRKELHLSYASFQVKKKSKKYEYLKEMEEKLDDRISRKLLGLTLSTKERLEDYDQIYKKIFKITGKPRKIIDLACGFNPISFPYMKLDKIEYYAYDISEEDIKFLNTYFKIMKSQGLNGKARILNLNNLQKVSRLPKCDVIFMFKIADILDSGRQKIGGGHKISEILIKKLIRKTKFVVVSFATHTLTRKKMKHFYRGWFEKMLERNKLEFTNFETSNEMFYVVW